MSFPPQIVTDANIWIDLHHGDVVDYAFQVDTTWNIPDVIFYEELNAPEGNALVASFPNHNICVTTLDGEEVQLVRELATIYPRPSRHDLVALSVSISREMMLLTGDSALRVAAEAEEVEVHGILWLLDGFVDAGLMEETVAANALEGMVDAGSRLPQQECQDRLDEWKE